MKIGLVLSGGGVRGFAHIGALQALSELHIKIDMISGVSAGAIVGAFFCAGYKPKEIFDILVKNRYMAFSKITWFKNGIFSMDNLKKIFEKYFKQNNFVNLNIPLYITTTDIITGNSIIFSQGTLVDKIVASASIPIVFDAVQYKKYKLLDGGIIDNLPVKPLINKCDKIIAINVNPIQKITDTLSITNILDRVIHMMINQNILLNKRQCDIFIEPKKLSRYGIFDLQKATEIYNIGYKAILSNKNNLFSIMSK